MLTRRTINARKRQPKTVEWAIGQPLLFPDKQTLKEPMEASKDHPRAKKRKPPLG